MSLVYSRVSKLTVFPTTFGLRRKRQIQDARDRSPPTGSYHRNRFLPELILGRPAASVRERAPLLGRFAAWSLPRMFRCLLHPETEIGRAST